MVCLAGDGTLVAAIIPQAGLHFLIFHLAWGTVLFLFVAIFVTRYATSGRSRVPVCLLTGDCGYSVGGSQIWSQKYQTCLIFTIQDWGGSDSTGSNKIIALTLHIWGLFGQIVGCDKLWIGHKILWCVASFKRSFFHLFLSYKRSLKTMYIRHLPPRTSLFMGILKTPSK